MLNDRSFINIAKEIALASKCVSKQVGAVIVKDGRIFQQVTMEHQLVTKL